MKTLFEYIQKKQISITTDYVDLDLPSGTLWATMNIGAKEGDKPEDWYGLYFAWGETKGYKASDRHHFSLDNYQFSKKDDLSKYNHEDKLTQLEKEDDAVYQMTGGDFRMPTDKELKELYEYTNNEWVKNYNNVNGLNGRLFASKKDETKSIFIPASGYRDGFNINPGISFSLWCSILNSTNIYFAYTLFNNSHYMYVGSEGRYIGFVTRGVLNK